MSKTEEESDIEKELHAMFESGDSSNEARLRKYVHDEKNSAISLLVSSVVHDSRGLITPIVGMAEMGKMHAEERGDADTVDCFATILESAEKLTSLINNMLDFSKRKDLTRGTVYITDLLESVLKIYKSQYVHEGINLETNLSDDVPVIDGFSAGIESVFMNMLTNALQAYEEIPKERPKTMQVRAYHKEGYVFIEFEDDACGILQEDLPKIFDAWYTTKGKKGFGIGLANALAIIKNSHLGKISVKSEYGKGTKFTIKIPDAQSVKVMREETYFGQKREPNPET